MQRIKLVQAEVGKGSETVRSPLAGAERDAALQVIRDALSSSREPMVRVV
ncbi:MAG TPA: hypothetical protein VMN60_09680 [Longimicrobiales bacterium]|nr:hypothetical protein [Longimicrobiales bacterium]